VLVEAKTSDGGYHSILLQNAETVRLIGPDDGSDTGWRAISVSKLQVGDELLLLLQGDGARHTGILILEQISEK
jgi:3-dehydroquinate synthase class II